MRNAIILVCIVFCLTSCQGYNRNEVIENPVKPPGSVLPEKPITPLAPTEQPKPGKDGKVDPLAAAKYTEQEYAEQVAKYTALQAEAKKRVEFLTDQARKDAVAAEALWITIIGMICAALCGVAAFFAPIGKKTLIAAAIGFTAVAMCAQVFAELIPYFCYIGGALLIGGGIWACCKWSKLGNMFKHASEYADDLEQNIQDKVLAALPQDVQDQAIAVIKEVKDNAKIKALAKGYHKEMQYLRGKAPIIRQRVVSDIKGKVT